MILAILAFASILVFFPGLHDSFGLAKIAYLSLLAPVALVSLCLLFFSGRQVKVPLAPLIVSYILILILSPTPGYTHESIAQLSLDLTSILFFIYVVNRVRPDSIQSCMAAYVLIVLLMVLFSLLAWRWPELAITGRPFIESTMGNTKYPGLLVLSGLPLAFYLAGNMKAQWQKIVFTCGAVFLVLSVLVAGTRIISGAFYPVLTSDQRSGVVNSFLDRVEIWKAAEPMIRKAIPFGIGRGNFQLHYPKQDETVLTTHAHNDYLELLIETGPLGISLFLSIALTILLGYRSSILGNYLKVSILTILLLALFWFPFEIAPMAISYWIFLGLIYVDSNRSPV